MQRRAGPVNPVSPHPNGIPGYCFNPVEDLPVAEDHLMKHNFADDYYTEPVFSSQALYGFRHKAETYDTKNRRD